MLSGRMNIFNSWKTVNKNSTHLERLLQTRKWQVAYQSISPGLVSLSTLWSYLFSAGSKCSAAAARSPIHLASTPPVCTPYLTPTHLEMRLTAPWAVRGGKNSRDTCHQSPSSASSSPGVSHIVNNPGVEHLGTVLGARCRCCCPPSGARAALPLGSFTMAEDPAARGEGRGRETAGQVAEPQHGRVR